MAVDAELVLVAEDRDDELGPEDSPDRLEASECLRPRLSVERPSVSICASFAFDQPAGTAPPSKVAFSCCLRLGRRAWITVAPTICPPIARSPAARSTASKRENRPGWR